MADASSEEGNADDVRASERSTRVARRPIQRFLSTEAASGILLLLAAIVALAWANIAPQSYATLWGTRLPVGVGEHAIDLDLRHWINEAAMALFFFVVGLEIKREFVSGELRDRRAVALPIGAALGGMIVPALLYLAITAGTAGARGWGMPMATDIAFAVGVLAIVGRRLPASLKLFVLAFAIVDDVGAILVIALFYSTSISVLALGLALGMLALTAALRRLEVAASVLYLALGIGVWIAMYASGVHATIAGVAVAFVTPAVPSRHSSERGLEHALHPWTGFVIVPLFALANAGVRLGSIGASTQDANIILGVVIGLAAGKTLGISFGAWVVMRLRLARLPEGVRWMHLIGAAAVGGIGFTVSLFVAGLAFDDSGALAAAKIGILVGSVISGVAGAIILACARSKSVISRA